ncbi:hypothetical protein PTI45_01175 [Paenibacillus nuruki]|uniref:Uncharacterized protein n=1 Tax=Paenibacillus nuruki TaxID=1886670 RepID=A0A1E3L601_9BACL|nr:hypothetical protein [Paenibacillus nuruki]ODP29166.1 hypothetical protein PTI45_01175 [Paenibacillus nuruki]
MNIQEAFNQLLANRMDYIGEHILSEMEDFQRLNDECSGLFAMLNAAMSEEMKRLWLQYEDKMMLIQGLAESMMYEKGLRDGVELSRILSK